MIYLSSALPIPNWASAVRIAIVQVIVAIIAGAIVVAIITWITIWWARGTVFIIVI